MWIWDDPMDLFSIDIIPESGDDTSSIINKVSRMIFIILVIMIYFSYDIMTIAKAFAIGVIILLILYSWITNKKEKFSSIDYKMDSRVSDWNDTIPSYSIEKTSIESLSTSNPSVSKQSVSASQSPSESASPKPVSPSKTHPEHVSSASSASSASSESLPLKSVTLLTSLLHPNRSRETYQGYQENNMPLLKKQQDYYTPYVGENLQMKKERVILPPRLMDPQFQNSETNAPINSNPLQNFGGMRFQEPTRKNSMLLTPTEYEEPIQVTKPNRMFLQNVQPHVYSFTNDRTPVNASIGISSTPQIPELSKQTIRGDDGKVYPLYSRIDPELVRDDVDEGRRAEMPKRNEWSEELPSTNPLNTTNVYDPRFTGYGDDARSYYDSNLGQIRYYYTDVDAYRTPNFIVRNKVDHVDLSEPMGNTYSMYPRTASLEDVQDQVNNDWMAKSTEFREDIMEKLMRKNNSMNWQMRFAPKSKGSNLSSFSSRY